MTKYKVVRSYGPDSMGQTRELQSAFDIGYEFVRASEYVEGLHGKAGYIEYILKKEVEE